MLLGGTLCPPATFSMQIFVIFQILLFHAKRLKFGHFVIFDMLFWYLTFCFVSQPFFYDWQGHVKLSYKGPTVFYNPEQWMKRNNVEMPVQNPFEIFNDTNSYFLFACSTNEIQATWLLFWWWKIRQLLYFLLGFGTIQHKQLHFYC